MHAQPDLFPPMCRRQHHRQGELFDQAGAIDADSDLTCVECGARLVRTDGYLSCPNAHGRLIECTVSTVDLAIEAEATSLDLFITTEVQS